MRTLECTRRLAISIGSFVALAALTVGVPLVLARVAGWPLPRRIPTFDQAGHALAHGALSDSALIKTIALIGWAAWLQIIFSVTLEISAWARRRPSRRLAFAGPLQPAVRALIASAALILSSPVAQSSAATPLRPQNARVSTRAGTTAPILVAGLHGAATVEPAPAAPSYTVVPGDTLWDIAARQLGDPFRWHEIYDLNRGKSQPDATKLEDPDLILPGWVLTLPAEANGLTNRGSPPGPAPVPSPPTAVSTGPTAPTPAPSGQTPYRTTPSVSAPRTTEAPPSVPAGGANTDGTRSGTRDDRSTRSPKVPTLVFGGGIAAAGLVALLMRLRLVQRRQRRTGRRPRTPTPDLEQTERKLRQLADLDRAEFLDLALRAFAAGTANADSVVPEVIACRVGQSQVELLLAVAPERPPKGFEPMADERGWVTSPNLCVNDLRELAAGIPAPLPSLVSLGTLEDGELLIDIESVGLFTVDGDHDQVTGLIRALLTQLATAQWIDHVDVIVVNREAAIDIPGAARVRELPDITSAVDELTLSAQSFSDELRAVESHSTLAARLRDTHDSWIPTILVCDSEIDEANWQRLLSITAGGGRGVGVVAHSSRHARWHAELCAAELVLSPLNFRIRPNLIDTDSAQELQELLISATVHDSGDTDASRIDASQMLPVRGGLYADPAFDIEVRVLGTVQIAGLSTPMTRPKCVELAAYLALHPRGVTDDRLKTALWSEATPVPSHFNSIVSTTRVQLGYARDGTQHLPRYQASGQLYCLGPFATTDLARFEARVAHARQSSPSDAIVTLRSAFELIRGQPFETTRGFEWAFSEGFVASAEATVADAAHTLAQHYLEAGDTIGATWAAEQGLKAAPGDEALYRDRMMAYDLAGNPGGVERVMDELCRVVEALEPYDTLHPETLALYEQISHRKRTRVQT